jgi:hypothetical protein
MKSDRIGWRDAPVGRQGAHAGRGRTPMSNARNQAGARESIEAYVEYSFEYS